MSRAADPGVELAHLLGDAVRRRRSGLLTARRGKLRRVICLRRGRLVHVASNMIEEQLEALLVSQRLLTAEQREGLVREAKLSDCRPAMLLLRLGEVSPDDLYRIASDRVRDLLRDTLTWPNGEFEFTNGRPDLAGELTVDFSCAPLLFEHALVHPRSLDEVRRRTGPADTRPMRHEAAPKVLEELKLDSVAGAVLESSDGFLTAAELVARVGDAQGAASRALYALMLVGVIRAAARDEVPRLETVEAVSRQEVLARLAHLDAADHYSVLGLNRQATTEQVRDAYYYLARRYHPDRYRTGELEDLLSHIEAFFTRVTEAYNVLFDPEQRRQYDEETASPAAARTAEPQQDTAYLARQNFARGKLLVEKKQFHDALRFFENAVELDSMKADYHLELGLLLARNPRRRDDAERSLTAALQMNPALVAGYLALGDIYAKTDRAELAIAKWEEALRWDPANVEAHERLGRSVDEGGARGRLKGIFGG